ncbi:MAG TPA: hypothetical protein VFK65_25415 [Candidatus Binatia bacterium]|nr:hypothetical protein [Candidatus Binatia bacterium]
MTIMILIALLLTGCFSSQPKNKPSVNDLSGVWAPDKATLRDMAERGGYDPALQTKLILHANGNLELVNMPDWWESMSGESGRGLHSYTGSWEITKSGKYWELAIYSSIMNTKWIIHQVFCKIRGSSGDCR